MGASPKLSSYESPKDDVNEKGEATWWKKAMVCNFIDVKLATGTTVILILVGVSNLFFGPQPWLYAPMVPGIIYALWAKGKGGEKFAEYAKTKDADTLWW